MATSLVRPPGNGRIWSGRRRLSTPAVGNLALAWALAYVPIHVYWALGGLSTPIGITGHQQGFRVANWGACVVIIGAGLTCLVLTRSWGAALPPALRRGTARVGGVFGLVHWALYTVLSALRLAGVVGYPADGDPTAGQLHNFDWANVGYFELWFGVMGLLLLACARRDKASRGAGLSGAALSGGPLGGAALRGAALSGGRPVLAVRVGTAVSLAGIAIVIWGVFTFAPWLFAAAGPAVLAAGLTVLIVSNSRRTSR